MSFIDGIKERISGLETKHYYMIAGGVLVIIVIIVVLSVLSSAPGKRFGEEYHEGEVARLVFDAAGSRLATSELNQQAKAFVWEVPGGGLLGKVDGNATNSRMIAFPEDKDVLITAGLDERVYFWGINTGSKRRDIRIELSAYSALSPDGKWLAYTKGPKTFVWDITLKPDKENDIFDGNATS